MHLSYRAIRNLGLGTMLLIIFLVSLFSYSVMSDSSQKLETIITIEEAKLKKWHSLQEIIVDCRGSLYEYIMGRNDVLAPASLLIISALREIDDLREMTDSEEESSNLERLQKEFRVLKQAVYAYGIRVREGDNAGKTAKELETEAFNAMDHIVRIYRETVEDITYKIEENNTKILRTTQVSEKILAAVLIVSTLSTILIALFMGRSLARPIHELVDAASQVAEGNLTKEITIESGDEIGKLSRSFHYMIEQLRKQRAQLVDKDYVDSIFANMAESLIVMTPEGNIRTANNAACQLTGYTEEELTGESISLLFTDITNDGDKNITEKSTLNNYETRIRAKDGRLIPVLYSVSLMRDKKGEMNDIIFVVNDITGRKKADELLFQSRRDWENTFDTIPDMITLHNKDFHIISANRAAREYLNLPDMNNGKPLYCYKYYHGTDLKPEGCPSCKSMASRSSCNFEIFEPHLNKFVEIRTMPQYDNNDEFRGIIHIVRDITIQKNAEKKLEHQAYHDQLTNLVNRAFFKRLLGQLTERLKRHRDNTFAVLFMDLDRFKVINDSLGHMIGDKLLVAVTDRLKQCTRPEDTVARFGGDEFAVLIENMQDPGEASRVAGRIMDKLALPFSIDGHEVFTTASIGIALSTTGYENEEDILRDADAAMYRAKALGRERYEIFDTNMHARAVRLLQLEADLRRSAERGEFLVSYQPVISLASNRIAAAEALIRWEHPKQGIISPVEFIPLAEETGLISAIGEWILRTACTQTRAWHDAGYRHLGINVNFSARQFQHNDLSNMIRNVLRDTGLQPQHLNIEITESIAMEDYCIELLNELAATGIKIMIDDFGTGFSSLGSLKRFPIHAVKIDKSFVRDIAVDRNDEAIVKAIIAMAQSLRMEVVAEGVETKEQLLFLQSNLCDKVQGFLFSRPLNEREFIQLLEQGFSLPSEMNDDADREMIKQGKLYKKLTSAG